MKPAERANVSAFSVQRAITAANAILEHAPFVERGPEKQASMRLDSGGRRPSCVLCPSVWQSYWLFSPRRAACRCAAVYPVQWLLSWTHGLPSHQHNISSQLVRPSPLVRWPLAVLQLTRVRTDDDDFDEDSIPGFTHPQAPAAPPPPLDKGKRRAHDTLLPPPTAPPNGTGTSSSSNPLAGNIGTTANGATPKGDRRTVGGLRVETRYVAPRDIPLDVPVFLPC